MIQFGPCDNLTRQILAESNMRSTGRGASHLSKSCHLAKDWSHQGRICGLPFLMGKRHPGEKDVLQMGQNYAFHPNLPEGTFSGNCHLAEGACHKIARLNHNIFSGVSPAGIFRLLGAAAASTFLSLNTTLGLRHSLALGTCNRTPTSFTNKMF